jgi:hypothetical protein
MNRRSCPTSGSRVWWELTSRERWLQALSIDLQTGLDPPGFKVRAAQGLDAAVRLPSHLQLTSSPSSFKDIGSGKRSSRI